MVVALQLNKQSKLKMTQSVGAAEYTDCISAEGYESSKERVLHITLNNLMVRFQ